MTAAPDPAERQFHAASGAIAVEIYLPAFHGLGHTYLTSAVGDCAAAASRWTQEPMSAMRELMDTVRRLDDLADARDLIGLLEAVRIRV